MSNKVKNINGMSLTNPSPFFASMQERDPTLFLVKKTSKYNAYSRLCPSNVRRQPVILTDEELQKIKDEYPGALKPEDVLTYGSNPKKKYNYVCPQYWCLLTNSYISEKDAKEGKKCGKIIPSDGKDSKKVPKEGGYYVYDFSRADENYVKHFPGFVKEGSHPEDKCIPCCFKNWDVPSQLKRKKECMSNEKLEEHKKKKETGKSTLDKVQAINASEDTLKEKEKPKVVEAEAEPASFNIAESRDYIKGPDKMPLTKGRWGYLPTGIQIILHEVNADCQISKSNTNVKPFHECLLRQGVELSTTQSFIACLSNAKYYNERNVKSIIEMKQEILGAITLDSFIMYQNGNLPISFAMPLTAHESINLAKLPKTYTESSVYKHTNIKTEQGEQYLRNIISAFENFKRFLESDDVVIDYTYLWDLVCTPNPKLFPKGLNLIIFNIPDNDVTENIELVCPSNHYSTEFYNARKPTLLLIQKGEFFEPIYAYKDLQASLNVTKLFREYDPNLSKTMRAVFRKIIIPMLSSTCQPLPSMPNKYKFTRAIELPKLIQLLLSNPLKLYYDVLEQVVNFQSKVIGLIVQSKATPTNPSMKGFVPCYPSSINPVYAHKYMNDDNIWSTYANTIEFLHKLYTKSKGKIPSDIAFKVVEDHVIVGVLTITNQFVQTSNPIPVTDVHDKIPLLDNNNYVVLDEEKQYVRQSADTDIMLSNEVDTERVDYIKKIKLETNFYNVFRNTVRILLNDYTHIALRKEIEDEIDKKPYVIYNAKLALVIELLKRLTNKYIRFARLDFNELKKMSEVSTCIINKTADQCKAPCEFSTIDDINTCQLILPQFNLIQPTTNNENQYFSKMADELIRYNRIKSFIFQPQTYLAFSNIGYNLRNDEIILLQSLLTKEYFDGLIPAQMNRFVTYNTYDTIEPIQSQPYANEKTLDETINPDNVDECVVTVHHKITAVKWRKCFPETITFNEIEYSKTIYCTFVLVIEIIKRATGKTLTIPELKQELFKELSKYNSYLIQMLDILSAQGKRMLCDQVKTGHLTLYNMIMSDSYFLTNLDLWALLGKYNIPTIIISTHNLLETDYENDTFAMLGTESDKFVFILSPAVHIKSIPGYKLIQDANTQNIFFPMSMFTDRECITKITRAVKNVISIENYISNFRRTTIYKPKTKRHNLKRKIEAEEGVAADIAANVIEDVAVAELEEIKSKPTTTVIRVSKSKKNKKAVNATKTRKSSN